jgi:hypothetical protein
MTKGLPPSFKAMNLVAQSSSKLLKQNMSAYTIKPKTALLLLVAGGGGGGGGHATNTGSDRIGGGGGGGGLIFVYFDIETLRTESVVIGNGGIAGNGAGVQGGDGQNSSAFGFVAIGGGGGGGGSLTANSATNGRNGGSGGGRGGFDIGSPIAGKGVAGQGFDGGAFSSHGGSAQGDGDISPRLGLEFPILNLTRFSRGGTGGNPTSGVIANTGAGGGGANNAVVAGSGLGQNGASGIAIFAYPQLAMVCTGGVITNQNGLTLHTFNSNGNLTRVS